MGPFWKNGLLLTPTSGHTVCNIDNLFSETLSDLASLSHYLFLFLFYLSSQTHSMTKFGNFEGLGNNIFYKRKKNSSFPKTAEFNIFFFRKHLTRFFSSLQASASCQSSRSSTSSGSSSSQRSSSKESCRVSGRIEICQRAAESWQTPEI